MEQNSETLIETEWLAALGRGEEGALRSIFDAHYRRLVETIYRIVGEEETSKDLAQEIFMDLWNKRSGLLIHTSLGAYLHRAAVNRAINHLKSQRRVVVEGLDALPDQADSTAGDQRRYEEQESLEKALHRAIDDLPERCRLVFTLSRFGELSHREIGDQLGISIKTIENQITKAMKMLRLALVNHAEMSPMVILALKYWLGS